MSRFLKVLFGVLVLLFFCSSTLVFAQAQDLEKRVSDKLKTYEEKVKQLADSIEALRKEATKLEKKEPPYPAEIRQLYETYERFSSDCTNLKNDISNDLNGLPNSSALKSRFETIKSQNIALVDQGNAVVDQDMGLHPGMNIDGPPPTVGANTASTTPDNGTTTPAKVVAPTGKLQILQNLQGKNGLLINPIRGGAETPAAAIVDALREVKEIIKLFIDLLAQLLGKGQPQPPIGTASQTPVVNSPAASGTDAGVDKPIEGDTVEPARDPNKTPDDTPPEDSLN